MRTAEPMDTFFWLSLPPSVWCEGNIPGKQPVYTDETRLPDTHTHRACTHGTYPISFTNGASNFFGIFDTSVNFSGLDSSPLKTSHIKHPKPHMSIDHGCPWIHKVGMDFHKLGIDFTSSGRQAMLTVCFYENRNIIYFHRLTSTFFMGDFRSGGAYFSGVGSATFIDASSLPRCKSSKPARKNWLVKFSSRNNLPWWTLNGRRHGIWIVNSALRWLSRQTRVPNRKDCVVCTRMK